jgi:hypothetical protein
MYLRRTPNLLHFLPDLNALYALRPPFMKSTPGRISKSTATLDWIVKVGQTSVIEMCGLNKHDCYGELI